ncbi:MAG: tetratricopeptide repeat protein [Bacteroidetes bacterium]|nr:tetratricopeptide repeat protein [Bacteroidota bacterium]
MRNASSLSGVIVVLILNSALVNGQSVRSLVHEGNDLYERNEFDNAEINYRKALEQEHELVQGHFNLGNALHKQGNYEDAVREFERAAMDAQHEQTRAFAYYNIGNSRFEKQQFREAIGSYIESLKLNLNDEDAKYNLSLALKRLEEQQQQEQQQDQNKNQDKNRNQDQQDENQQQQDRDRDQQGEKDKDQRKQQREQKPAKQQPKRMSRADAERILDVLKNSEKEIQKKLKARKAVRPKGEKDW